MLAAGLAPSTISHLKDGSRFDYRPALARVQAEDPRGTVVLWPLVQATWAAPDLKSIELRSSTTVSLFDSLLAARDRYWVITSQRRYGLIGDADGRKQQWLSRHCDRVLTTGTAALRLRGVRGGAVGMPRRGPLFHRGSAAGPGHASAA